MIKKKQLKIHQNRLIIWAAKGMFKSAKKLATALKPDTPRQVLIVRSDNPRFKPRLTDVIVNWGNANYPQWGGKATYLNTSAKLFISVNKLKTFQALQGHVRIPEWTTDWKQALEWLKDTAIMARTTLTGFGGKGCYYIEKNEEIAFGHDFAEPVKLFVKYKKKAAEYRVHVFKEKIIDITQKKKRAGFEDVNTKIRNYENGWVYCREGINVPDDVKEQAVKAVRHLGLDFGAVDIIFNNKEQQAYVLEVNSAPGLEGSTIEAYKQAILSTL